jgi:hypothetical protein
MICSKCGRKTDVIRLWMPAPDGDAGMEIVVCHNCHLIEEITVPGYEVA